MNMTRKGSIRTLRRIVRRTFDVLEEFHYRHLYKPPSADPAWRQRPLLFGDWSPGQLTTEYRKRFPQAGQCVLAAADRICAHQFDLLGSGPVALSESATGYAQIDWHRDFKGNNRWDPQTFHKHIRFGNVPGADIKFPWELSRFQHAVILGQAGRLSGQERYAQELCNQIYDWIAQNPTGLGVNWTCTMDVALRAVNWLVGVELILAEPGLDDEFAERFYRALRGHGRFIRGHLEYSVEGRANHYLAGVAGLFFIALYCPFLPEAMAWRDFGAGELEREILTQVRNDGCGIEASTSYHRLTLEILFYCFLLADRSGIPLSNRYRAQLKTMFVAASHLLAPGGRMPQIGDNDNGHFLQLAVRPPADQAYLLDLAAILYQDPLLKPPERELQEDAFWAFGRNGLTTWDAVPCADGPVGSAAFPEAGWYVLRDDQDYCLISCGPNGPAPGGGHSHNDKLSLELVVAGHALVVDPGTGTYTADPVMRNRFRATAAHNTVQVGRVEQNEIPRELFRLPDRVAREDVRLRDEETALSFAGTIRYGAISHRRSVSLSRRTRSWLIEDEVTGSGADQAIARLHLAPGLTYQDGIVRRDEDGVALARIEMGPPDDLRSLTAEAYDYSPSYGVTLPAVVLAIRSSRGVDPDGSWRLVVRISPL